jgi:D-glycero-D-manno-heptose 1,7-bisphosphate phosphatase
MLIRAAGKYNIDLSQSFMVGDDMRDVLAGINAGCEPVFLGNTGRLAEAGRAFLAENRVRVYSGLGEFASDEFPAHPDGGV